MRVHPGDRIDGRYRVYVQTDENWGVCGWRARDEVLGRDVLLTTFQPEDPRADALVTAARVAARVEDHRFVRVLDAHIDEPTGFLVREWIGGQSVSDLLGPGPLPEDVAATIARDVALALQRAHQIGQYHLCIDATTVIIDQDGAVRIRGLGTAAVLRGIQPSPEGPSRDDARGVGRLMYAMLTGRLPEPGPSRLPVVPQDGGAVPAPRQVRAGVSPLMDAITVRALGSGRARREQTYASPGEIAVALRQVAGDEPGRDLLPAMASPGRGADHDVVELTPESPAPQRRPAIDPGSPVAPAPVTPPDETRPEDHDRAGRSWIRPALIAAAILLGIGMVLLAYELIAANRLPDIEPIDTPRVEPPQAAQPDQPAPVEPDDDPGPTPVVTVPIASVADYDPLGNGAENSDRTPLAIDGDPATTWTTQTYYDPLEVQKAGVGLLLDLGRPAAIAAVDLALIGESADVEVRVAPADADAVPASPDEFVPIGRAEQSPSNLSIVADPHTTRYVLVWFTRLPRVSDGWRGGVSEVVVRG